MERLEEFFSSVALAIRARTTRAMVHRLRKVYVEPTTRCNLRCRTCMRKSWDEPAADMTMETYGRLLDSLRAVRTVKCVAYWGIGEPLMHPRIVDMIGSAPPSDLAGSTSLEAVFEVGDDGLEPPTSTL